MNSLQLLILCAHTYIVLVHHACEVREIPQENIRAQDLIKSSLTTIGPTKAGAAAAADSAWTWAPGLHGGCMRCLVAGAFLALAAT